MIERVDWAIVKQIASFLSSLDNLSFSVVIDKERGSQDGKELLELDFEVGDPIESLAFPECPLDPSLRDIRRKGRRPLLTALQTVCTSIKLCDPELVAFLLKHEASVNARLQVNVKVFWGDEDSTVFTAYKGSTAPHLLLDTLVYTGEVATEKRIKCLELMLSHDYHWGVDKRGFSILHAVAKSGNVELARVSLNAMKCAQPRQEGLMDLRDYHDGKTALMIAVETHNLPLVKLLVERGALISPKTVYTSSSVLHRVLSRGNYISIELRFRENSDIKEIDRTMWRMAIFLVEHSSITDLQQEDVNGYSPLYHACASGYFEVAGLMIDRGAMDYSDSGDSEYGKRKTGLSPAIACLRYARYQLLSVEDGTGIAPQVQSEEPAIKKASSALALIEAMCARAKRNGKRSLIKFINSLDLGADFHRDNEQMRCQSIREWSVFQSLARCLGSQGEALLSQFL